MLDISAENIKNAAKYKSIMEDVTLKRIITISREFGSGGHTIGEMVAERLKISFYDQKLIEKAMIDTGFSEEFIKEAGEYAVSTNSLLFRVATASVASGQNFLSNYDKVYLAQNKIIKEIASQEPCVIVGRCSDYILRDTPDCLNVFIHSDIDDRIKRVRERYGECSNQSVEARIIEKDKKRGLYYKHYTGQNWGNARNYHLSVNSGTVGIERCVAWIAELVTQ